MKRDMELVRSILIELEEMKPYETFIPIREEKTKEELLCHLELMSEADLIEIEECGILGKPRNLTNRELLVVRMKWKGYEFLDLARDDKAWKEAKERIGQNFVSCSFTVLANVLSGIYMMQINGT